MPIKTNAIPKRTAQRVRTLIELMLCEMHACLKEPERLNDATWEKLFGPKQSMIANLQKLVGALVLLPEESEAKTNPEKYGVAPLTQEEMRLLTDWVRQKESGED